MKRVGIRETHDALAMADKLSNPAHVKPGISTAETVYFHQVVT
jgi:hypothetical protein